jgi:hypothetical protein
MTGALRMEERRHDTRLRSLKSGTILRDYAPSLDCVIRNLSKSGALLDLKAPVPESFLLLIKLEPLKRNCRSCGDPRGASGYASRSN